VPLVAGIKCVSCMQVILGADVIYDEDLTESLLSCGERMMRSGGRGTAGTGPGLQIVGIQIHSCLLHEMW
jgi:hypothetical protein